MCRAENVIDEINFQFLKEPHVILMAHQYFALFLFFSQRGTLEQLLLSNHLPAHPHWSTTKKSYLHTLDYMEGEEETTLTTQSGLCWWAVCQTDCLTHPPTLKHQARDSSDIYMHETKVCPSREGMAMISRCTAKGQGAWERWGLSQCNIHVLVTTQSSGLEFTLHNFFLCDYDSLTCAERWGHCV